MVAQIKGGMADFWVYQKQPSHAWLARNGNSSNLASHGSLAMAISAAALHDGSTAVSVRVVEAT